MLDFRSMLAAGALAAGALGRRDSARELVYAGPAVAAALARDWESLRPTAFAFVAVYPGKL